MDKIPFLNDSKNWINMEGPEMDVVVSSRVRLARNLENAPFTSQAKPADLKMIWQLVAQAAGELPFLKKGLTLSLADISALDREILKERHLISQPMSEAGGDRGLLTDLHGNLVAMVNEEDHLRMASLQAGLQIKDAWKKLNQVDDAFGEKLAWAYDARWGFLTACPTNCGTGLRVSARLHLPALSLTQQLKPVLEGPQRLGIVARGFYGEGTQALGDMFQLSNAASLGRSEEEILEQVHKIVLRVVHHERQSREKLFEGANRLKAEDTIYRAMGTLSSARTMNYQETMVLLSRVRLGVTMKLPLPVTMSLIHGTMVLTQPGHLQKLSGKTMPPHERDQMRTDLIRKGLALGKNKER